MMPKASRYGSCLVYTGVSILCWILDEEPLQMDNPTYD